MAAWTPLLFALSLATGRVTGVPHAHGAPESEAREEQRTWTVCRDSARRLAEGPTALEPGERVNGDGVLFFSARDGEHGRELWRSSGGDTARVKDVRPGALGSAPRSLTMLGRMLYFIADDGVHGDELWRSDGTEAGTVRVRDVRSGAEGSTLSGLSVFNGRLWFAADDGVSGFGLWASDGTEAGTVRVRTFAPPGANGYLTGFTVMGGALYFVSSGGPEATLWRFDGASFTPVLSGDARFLPYALTAVGERLFFLVDGDAEPGEDTLYVTDGTREGTRALRTFEGSMPLELTAVGGRLMFAADDGDHGVELWTSDGTEVGTRLVKDVSPGSEDASPFYLTAMKGRVYFSAEDGLHGRELWSSDGTAEGTVRVTDLAPGEASASPAHLAAVQGTLFFSASTAEYGPEVWLSDGTEAGTRALREGARTAGPRGFMRSGGDVFFSAEGSTGAELWAVPLRPVEHCEELPSPPGRGSG
jgi:ELWxxDGT repeat protein